MSGPKSSSYTLSARQRALLLEQQRKEQERALERQRVQAETKKKNRIISEINNCFSEIEQRTERLDKLQSESGYAPAETNEVKNTLIATKSEFAALLKMNPSTSAGLKKQNSELHSLYTLITNTLRFADNLSESLDESYRKELTETIQSGLTLSFSGIEDAKKQDNAALNRINMLLSGISIEIPAPLLDRFKNIRKQADIIKNVEFLENFCSVVVVPFVKECKECEGFDEVAAKYALLAAEAHVQAQSFDCTAAGLSAMKEASARLETIILEDRERSYINAALDAVMQEMGYRIVGNRTQFKKSGKRIRHELYSLNNGTAVDVTYTDNGQISMELGGIGTTDRSPSPEECEQLTADMHSFCQDYAELEKKLAERGVLTSQISHLPPSAEYAQILNINDYELTCSIENFQLVGRRTAARSARHME